MIIVCDLTVIFYGVRNGTSGTRNNYYFYKDRLIQLKRYFHFCDPNIPVPVVNDPALHILHKIRPVVSIVQEKCDTLYYHSFSGLNVCLAWLQMELCRAAAKIKSQYFGVSLKFLVCN